MTADHCITHCAVIGVMRAEEIHALPAWPFSPRRVKSVEQRLKHSTEEFVMDKDKPSRCVITRDSMTH